MGKLIRFNTVLSEANGIISSIRGYPKSRRTRNLYRQWTEKSGLQTDVRPTKVDKTEEAPSRVITANSPSSEPIETRQCLPKESKCDNVLYHGLPHGDMSPTFHDDIGNYVDSVRQKEPRKVAMFMMAEINREQLRVTILLVLLGASLVIFCLGVILLILYSFGL